MKVLDSKTTRRSRIAIVENVDKLIEQVQGNVITWRRHLHKHPELSFQEEKTAQFVYDTLCAMGNLEVSRPTKTSVMARLIGSQPGKVLALRADMDALALQEENSCDFASQNTGVMHACGHDAHTAMLLGTATVLSQLEDQIQGEVRFLFQHAEETPPGGSRELIKAGAMSGVDRIIGLHVMSHIPVGKVGIIYGAAMASSDTFDATIQGRGGHASQPHFTIDPVAIGAQVVTNLQHIVSRGLDPLEKLVVSVTTFHGGTANNIIPDTVTLQGSIRSFSKDVRQQAAEQIDKVFAGITAAHGASYTMKYNYGYDSVNNDQEITRIAEETVEQLWGKEAIVIMTPLMGGEDFAFYLNEAPGCFIFLGAANPEQGTVYPMHHPKFTIDEASMAIGVKLSVHAALKLLA